MLLGALHALPTAYPQLWWLQLLCVAGLAHRVASAPVGRSALLGFAFGTAWLCAGTWWLYVSMRRYGGLSAPLAAGAVLALSAFLSIYLSAAMALFAKLRRNRLWLDVLIFGGCWLLAELARGFILTGFPWAASGYAHVDSPLAMLAPVSGSLADGVEQAQSADTAAPDAYALPEGVLDATWQWTWFGSGAEQFDVDHPEHYTLHFSADGNLAIQADCNRGRAGFTVAAHRQHSRGCRLSRSPRARESHACSLR